MNIAYASENSRNLKLVGEYLRRYYDNLGMDVEICLFHDPETLIKSMQKAAYSLILLDSTYQEQSGVKLTYRIRRMIPSSPVVVIRYKDDGKVECIFVNPTMIVLDDMSERSFMSFLDIVRDMMYRTVERTVSINTVQNLNRIVHIPEIVYAEASGHRVIVHLTSGEKLETPGPIKILGDRLSVFSEFLYPHRSFIVNAFYVSCITPDALYLRTPAVTIPIARGKLSSVKQAYDDYFRSFGSGINMHARIGTDSE